jgi:hypothetical protein
MRLQILAGTLALAGFSAAFSDSAPFAVLSTSTLVDASNSDSIRTSRSVQDYTQKVFADCPTDNYLLISQSGLKAADLRQSDSCSLPHLCEAATDSRIQGRYAVSEVIGDMSRQTLASYIKSACGASQRDATIVELSLAPVSQHNTASQLAEHDAAIAQSLKQYAAGDSYTIVLLPSNEEPSSYEAGFPEHLRLDLKRGVMSSPMRRDSNDTEWERLPLFQKYQFFTPGVFMSLIAAILLLSILYVGLRALLSLEVSYGAFEKEMGPAAQRKQ